MRTKEPRTIRSFAIVALLAIAVAQSAGVRRSPQSPQDLFQELFVAVQMAGVFTDSKEFADAVPKAAPEEILAQYRVEKPRTRSALRAFVEAHFDLPRQLAVSREASQEVGIRQHIDLLWGLLTRAPAPATPYSSLLPLPRPFVVPGGRFREIYYWDSYFTMLGLVQSGRGDLVKDMLEDFAYLIDTFGHIPNGNRTYYLSRSQPPFFFEMVALLSPQRPAEAFAHYLPELKREYAFWMQGAAGLRPGAAHARVVALADGSILNRYWDDEDTPRDEAYREDVILAQSSGRNPRQLYRDLRAAAESGWDFSSRWFADSRTLATIATTEIVPVDLNSLLFGLERAIQSGCEYGGDRRCGQEFGRRATLRRAAIDRYLWDAAAGAYLDYRWPQRERIARVTAATLYPLFLGVAADQQAASVAKVVEQRLLEPGGVATTQVATGQQWDAPNGWAPLQWIAVAGLNRYGEAGLAEQIACRWMVNVARSYRRSGKLVEKYDVTAPDRAASGGEYSRQDGFGWTNGVLQKLMAVYPADADARSVEQCPGETSRGAESSLTGRRARPPNR